MRSRLLGLLCLTFAASVLAGSASAADPNLVGWWKLDETSGMTAADSSGNGNNGTLSGSLFGDEWAAGIDGGALGLNWNGYVNCGTGASLDITGDFTVGAWVKPGPGSEASYMGVGGRLVSAPSYMGFSLVRHSSGVYRLWVANQATAAVVGASSTQTYTAGEWHNVMGVRSGSACSLYVDGVKAGSADVPVMALSTNFVHIGMQYANSPTDRLWIGLIDDFRLYNRALTEAELAALVGVRAMSPSPADGATDVLMGLLQWSGTPGATMYDVYVGTSPTLGQADFVGRTPAPMTFYAQPLQPGATYYWRVDAVTGAGAVSQGSTWKFTVTPMTAHVPNPPDGAKWVGTTLTASWTGGQGAVSHIVYGDTDKAAVAAGDASTKLGTITETSFDASAILQPNTTYYWRIDEIDGAGVTSPGEVWSFSTFDPAGGAVAEYWDNMNLAGEAKVVKIVPEINFNWGDGPTQGTNSPDANIPTNLFSCRWTAELNVPVTGEYVLYEASDDGARMWLNGDPIASGWWDRGTTEDRTPRLSLVAGQRYLVVMEMYENGGGAAAYLRWAGPGIPKQIIPQGALMPPKGAFSLSPADGATGVTESPVLSWRVGAGATGQVVYLSTNKDKVAAGDPTVAIGSVPLPETSLTPAEPFGRGTTIFWKVDVVAADGAVVPGLVSSFRIADKNTDNWAAGISSSEPNYLATFVQNGTYDIGTFGDVQSYEFIVRCNPAETMTSLALIGRLNFGDTKAGLKYEQWNNTKHYGATLFGVMDYDYGVENAPGEYTHLVFVASKADAKTDLYVNGELKGSVPAAILLSGEVGIGRAIRANGTFVDDFDGTIFGVAIYGRALSADEIVKHADMYFNPIEITDADLLIYYDFEAGSGSTAMDQSGHSNHGQFMGSPDWATGIFGGCLSLDIASLDYVQTGAALGIVSNHVSVSAWVKHDQTPAAWSGILTHRGTSPGSFGLQHNGSEGAQGAELRYMWGPDIYWDVSTGLVIPNGEWYFAALTIAPDKAKFYLNGVDKTFTNVAEHVPVNFDSLVRVGRDHQDARIMTCLIDEVRFYNRTLTDVDIQRLVTPDVTAAGDEVQGVPNDNDWPGAEYPALVIDDNVNTKFLHFKGELLPTGIQVTPGVGSTVVTGLTFTTANDSPGRDPVKFELSGSNDGINGPWTSIAAGDIVDFAQATEWPRFTTNTTPISFANTTAYKHYQIVFPALRNPVTDPMMQIAEIELLGTLQ